MIKNPKMAIVDQYYVFGIWNIKHAPHLRYVNFILARTLWDFCWISAAQQYFSLTFSKFIELVNVFVVFI